MGGSKLNAGRKALHSRQCVLEVDHGKNITRKDRNYSLEQLSQQ